jgi:cell fate (sporulation/competence/biofilm development) regulator YmcA (YheA/YmcA/DUF963 family)
MKNLQMKLQEIKEANKNMVRFIKKGNMEAAQMWAEKLEKLENEL